MHKLQIIGIVSYMNRFNQHSDFDSLKLEKTIMFEVTKTSPPIFNFKAIERIISRMSFQKNDVLSVHHLGFAFPRTFRFSSEN